MGCRYLQVRHPQGFRFSDTPVRDQGVGGSNPLAPTTLKILPLIGLRYLLCFGCGHVLWTNVDRLEATLRGKRGSEVQHSQCVGFPNTPIRDRLAQPTRRRKNSR